MSALSSNVDDLDDFMNEFARALGQVLLKEISAETVKKIAGPGSVWPELYAQDIANELYLEVHGGSSGRPNRAAEIANMEKIVPLLIQVPGVSPEWLARELITRMDDKLNVSDALQAGLQSIVTMNSNAQPATGNPATDPHMQGGHGSNNSPGGPSNPNAQPSSESAPQGGRTQAPPEPLTGPAPNVTAYDASGNRMP
jgi:hypothetical protein